MNITELDNYRLSDAIKFHDRLNPRLWNESEHLRPEVKAKLLEIAADFQEFLGVADLDVKDITVSGSNAAYNYTPSSDIDLHLVVDLPEADRSEVFRELFDAKKYQYNDMHNIQIGGFDVELYVQDPSQEHHSQGIYSLMSNNWVSVPKRRKPEIDDVSVRSKAEDLAARIDDAVKSNDYQRIADLHKKIKTMRQTGLEQQGEYGSDNLAFKVLRNQGYIKKLIDTRNAARDAELSLQERKKKKKKVRYGFGGYWYPGFGFGGEGEGGGDGGGESMREDNTGMAQGSTVGDDGAKSTWDGVSPDTQGFLSEDGRDHENIVHDFIKDTASRLGIKRLPRIEMHRDPEWSQENKSFGMYKPELHELHVSLGNRHLLDILRTTAHELAHCSQHQRESLPDDAGDTGSEYENEAHAIAGIVMRDYADAHPELFMRQEIDEGVMSRAGAAAALAAAVAMTPAQAQDYLPQDQQQQVQQQGQLNPVQVLNIARTLYRLKHNVTRAGAEEELNQEFKNYLRAQQGDPGAQNQSRVWQIQQRRQQAQQPQQPWTGNQYQREGVQESSGYIPTEKQKNDPRFVMALSPDVRPGATGKNANKMALKTDSQGKPALLMKTVNLREGQNQDLNAPRGPESKPTMPAGTLRVDVSDVYDWYKLGQHISNMKGLGKHDFGQGAPSAIISFGDEDTEHKFIKDLEATGLDVTDIDPRDPVQRPGKKIKTDPAYNVDEDIVESLRQEFALLEDEYISEVRMSTANLRQLAAQTGAKAGMEFEMIVPDAGTMDLEPEWERDDGPDRRARSFDDIEEFFNDGDYNGRGDIRRLIEALGEAYQEWKMDQTADAWDDEGVDFFRDFVANNDLFDRDEALDQARDEVITANPNLPTDSEEFQQLVSARINELEEQYVLEEWERQGSHYSDAFEAFAEEKHEDYDEAEFLRETTPYMSDVESEYDIQWPYWYDANEGVEGEADIDEIANEFESAVGKPVNASRQYHGATRQAGKYVVEPDGSLEGDEPGDAGLEFVSPPMPIDELIDDLNKVKAWAGSRGCYTNDSTGLHINISVPDYSLDKLDYVKLALLMGDEYVLDLFGRSSNHYAKAATGKIRDALKKNPDLAPALMDKMRGHMEDLATKAIHSGRTDKYTSINTKEGYIEFRSPGGDWLDANFDKIENTLLRFTVALSAAIDPEAYRKEYLKKLYKLLEGVQPKEGVDVVQLFANYSSGELDKAALIRQVRQKQLARNVAKGKTSGPMWWNVSRPGYFASIEVVANNAEEAIASAILPGNYPDWASSKNTLIATPVRPYEAPEAKAAEPAADNQGNWGIWINANNRFANQPGSYSRNETPPLMRFPSREAAEQWIEQQRATRPNMRADIEVREIEPAVQDTGSATSGNWGVWVPALDRFATIGNAGPRKFETEADAQSWIQDYNARHSGNNLELVAREIEPAEPQQQSGRYTYRVYTDSGQTVGTFQSDGIQGSTAANIAFRNYLSSIGRDSASGFNYEEIGRERQSNQFQEPSDDRGDLTPRGPGPWEIYRLSDNSSVRELSNTDRMAAGEEARRALGLRGEAPELYGVRTRPTQNSLPGGPSYTVVNDPRDAQQGGIIDVAGEQPRQQTFTGEWDVLAGDEVVFRVRAETQGEANQKAREWILGRSREFLQQHEGQEISTRPRYAE